MRSLSWARQALYCAQNSTTARVTVGPVTTTLHAELPDQGALHGLIQGIGGLGLELVGVPVLSPLRTTEMYGCGHQVARHGEPRDRARVAHGDAIGILVLNEKGEVRADKLGKRSVGKGAGIGLVLALFTPVGLGVGLIGGGLLGALHHKGLGLERADRDRIGRELAGGK